MMITHPYHAGRFGPDTFWLVDGHVPSLEIRRFGAIAAPAGLIERTIMRMRNVADDASLRSSDPDPGAIAYGSAVAEVALDSPGGQASPPSRPDAAALITPAAKVTTAAQVTMEQLVNEHADAVYRVALTITGNPTWAEDASQDALIKAWQNLHTYRGDAPIRNWILRIAHNTAIGLVRNRRIELRAPADIPEAASTDRPIDVQVQDRLAIDRFQVALGQLDAMSRSIVVLREIEGLSYAEICDVLQLPMPTIKSRLLRSRRELAEALEGWQP